MRYSSLVTPGSKYLQYRYKAPSVKGILIHSIGIAFIILNPGILLKSTIRGLGGMLGFLTSRDRIDTQPSI